jgi:hypothetical protein
VHLYDCSYCEQVPSYLTLLGHDGPPAGLYTRNLVTNAELDRCPKRTILLAARSEVMEMRRYVDTYLPAYTDGFLLVPGGIADQPARYVELVQLGRSYQRTVEAQYVKVRAGNDTDGGED